MKKLFYLLIFLPLIGFSQSNTDSLFKIWLNPKKSDTTRLKAYDKYIQEKYLFSAPDTAYLLAQDELNYANKKGLKKEQANALNIMGISQAIQGNYEKAIAHFEKSVELRIKINDVNGIANSTNNLGLIYTDLGETKKAIEYFEKSLKIYEEKSNYKGITSILGNIGIAYHNIGDYRNAIEYYSRGLKWSEKKNDKKLIATLLSNIAIIHVEQKEYELALKELERCKKIYKEIGNDYELGSVYSYFGTIYQNKGELNKALEFYELGLELKTKVGDFAGIGNIYSNIGGVYKAKKEFTKALEYYELGLKNNEQGGMLQQIAGCYNNMGNIYFEMGNLDKAKFNSEKALSIANEYSYAAEISDASESLWKIYRKLGNESKALEMFEKFITTRDTLKSEENQKAIIQQQFQYQYEIQSAEDSLRNAEKEKVQNAEINQQKAEIKAKQNLQILLFGGLGLVVVFSIFIYNRFRLTQKQNKIIEEQKHEVEEKNKEITDSINYAKRIQTAILPPNKMIKEFLPESFVLYKPKDIVAGDFYWMQMIEVARAELNSSSTTTSSNQLILFAACDCTGHGVPGAMVSVVCNNGLNRSVREYGLTDPGKILDKTREIVIQEFEKSEEEVKDGMDVSLVNIEISNNEILKFKWAGANNPLWIVRKVNHFQNEEQQEYSLIEFKPNKQPIGKYAEPKPFTTHEIDLQKGDTIYIFTDGLQDQFGGEKGKKMKSAKLKELLLSIQKKNMDEQKILIEKLFERWKGDLEQNDDVCVIGVRI